MAILTGLKLGRAACFAAAGLTLAVPAAVASDLNIFPVGDKRAEYIVSVGATTLYTPRYEGSSTSRILVVPNFSFRRAGDPISFSAPDESLDFTLYSNDRFRIGPAFNLRASRNQGIDPRLTGLQSYPMTIEVGAFAEYWIVQRFLRARAEVLRGFRDDDGYLVNLSADAVLPISRTVTLSGGPRMTLADSRVMQLEFGVSAGASAANGIVAPFNATGGVKSTGFEIGMTYDWSDTWRITAYHRYDRLVESAAASPITTAFGTPNQFTFGLGFTYSFGVSTQ